MSRRQPEHRQSCINQPSEQTTVNDGTASMDVKSQLLELCGITARTEASSSSSIWDINPTSDDTRQRFASVNSLLKDYARGFTLTDNVADLPSRIRVDAILIMSLGIAKEKFLESLAGHARCETEKRLETLFWSPDQFISVPEPLLSPSGIQYPALDYVLWFGDTRKLQTNLVVLRVDESLDQVVEEQYCLAALAATCQSLIVASRTVKYMLTRSQVMIHHGRAKRPVMQGTYGIVTDGLRWIFLHVNKEGEYSSIKLNWMDGNEHTIVGLIGRIMGQAVAVKIHFEGADLDGSWSPMSRTWDSGELSLEMLEDSSILPQRPYTVHMLLDYTALHGDRHEHRLDEPHRAAKQDLQNRLSVRQQRDIETVAVTSIDPDEVFRMFRLTREVHPPDYWKVNHWERRPVSPQLGKSNRIAHVFGWAEGNKAAIRLIIDAVFLDVLKSLKDEAGQYEGNKGKGNGKRPSRERTLSLEDIRMDVGGDISCIFPTSQEGSIVNKRISGRMDYNMCYGQSKRAECNLLVVEARQKLDLNAGLYQAIAYMALIQHARSNAGYTDIPIYGIATDSVDWNFIRMDGNNKVDVEQFNWDKSAGSHIVSLLRKVIRGASLLTNSNGTPL
ncbi:hypothetical protein ASPCAL07770 [Aspergillus calidoustus]|uniref:Uncharacterized protein n=1 Tax=Aspergillus calidoustus TaxID=454130 RepID=A0A0U5GS13_ASPCI|nr:hypothetical protein ASPCAL07770 [Aspergillus calidoustus]